MTDGRTLAEKIQDRIDERRIEKYMKEAKEALDRQAQKPVS